MERRYLIILLFLCGGYLIAIADTLGICVKTIKRGGKLCSNNDQVIEFLFCPMLIRCPLCQLGTLRIKTIG